MCDIYVAEGEEYKLDLTAGEKAETAIFAGGRTYTRPIEVLVALVALFETGEIAPQMIVGGV